MKMSQILTASDSEVLQIAHQIAVGYRLKKTLRYNTKRNFKVHSESVAEHTYALFFLAQFFLPLEDPQNKLDKVKINNLILYQDFGEILHGDLPYHMKKPEHVAQEKQDAAQVFEMLPNRMGSIAYKLWQEYDAKKTAEAKFVNALDKLEPSFELLDPINAKSLKRLKFTAKMHIEKKLTACGEFPHILRFVNVIFKHLKSRGDFWEV